MGQVVGLPNNSYKPITNMVWVCARLCKLQKGCTRLAAASDKAYQLIARGRWFSPGTPASSTTKTGCHEIAEILLKIALNTKNQIITFLLLHFRIIQSIPLLVEYQFPMVLSAQQRALQEKFCKAEQDCFGPPGTGCNFSQNWGFQVKKKHRLTFIRNLSEFYTIIYLNKLKIVENIKNK